MIDISKEIKETKKQYIQRPLVRLVISFTENKLDDNELADIVRSEKWIEEKLMDTVNRTRTHKVTKPEEAIRILGIENCSFNLMNIFISELASNSKYPGISLILEMQIFMAEASYILAKKSMTEFPHRAYISALLSNISYFYISTFHPEEFEKILAQDSTSIKRMAAEWEIFGLDHAEISYLILGSSRVPSEIYEPVRYHHQKNLQISLGDNSTGNISLCTFFGSILTNMFYENFSLATEFRKDIKNLMGLYSDDLEDIIDEIIIAFRNRAKESGINKLDFPGYFKIISWFDTQMAMLGSEFEITRKKMTELNSQNLKYQKALEDNSRKLVGIALQDPLTGAFNRRYLGEKLSDEFLKAKRYGLNFTLISCDIDHFKNINDTYGHGYGDIVLIKLVQIIKSAIRKTDYIARIGGEEFLIVCHSSSGAGGYTIAEKIRKAIESTVFESEGNLIPVTMSFGVADYYPEVKSAEELIRISDERLYTAKNSGRNRVICK